MCYKLALQVLFWFVFMLSLHKLAGLVTVTSYHLNTIANSQTFSQFKIVFQ